MKSAITLALGIAVFFAAHGVAEAACPPFEVDDSIASKYVGDSDGDCVPDYADACPAIAGNSREGIRKPECYGLAGAAPSLPWLSLPDTTCVPAMVFRVSDGPVRGLVVVGTSASDATAIRNAIASEATTWTSALADARVSNPLLAGTARCLVSIDFGKGLDGGALEPVATSAQDLATLYATWCPVGRCEVVDPQPQSNDPSHSWPADGLGLVQDSTTVNLRMPLLIGTKPAYRQRFSRAVAYSTTPWGGMHPSCKSFTSQLGVDDRYLDPTAGGWSVAPLDRCSAPGASSVSLDDVAVISPDMEHALEDHTTQIDNGTATLTAIEGIPWGLRADIRTVFPGPGPFSSYPLANRALLSRGANQWFVVPEEVAGLGQTYTFARTSSTGPFTVTPLVPAHSADSGRRLRQLFSLGDDGDGSRLVEVFLPRPGASGGWPPYASTSDTSVAFGTRWTSTDGPPDCWSTISSTADPQPRFPYPTSSPVTSVATGWCPSVLDDWLARTEAARNSVEDRDGLCKASIRTRETQPSAVLAALSACAAGGMAPLPASTACGVADTGLPLSDATPPSDAMSETNCDDDNCDPLRCCAATTCDPFEPATCAGSACCTRFFKSATALNDATRKCVATRVLASIDASLPNSEHWKDVATTDGVVQMVPMVGMLRRTDRTGTPRGREWFGAFTPREVASVRSEVPTGDAFIGGAHQGPDWNWVVDKDVPEAIDPAYRAIAIRQGRFLGIENELEMAIAYLDEWSLHPPLEPGEAFNRHGRPLDVFFHSQEAAEALGEVWADDWLRGGVHDPFAIKRGHESNLLPYARQIYDSLPSYPSILRDLDPATCDTPAHYRPHLGRGIFAPLVGATLYGSNYGADRMFVDPKQIRSGAPTVRLGIDDWSGDGLVDCPHRIGFFGRPIVDCGHGDERCEPGYRLEIHPPHLLTMELRTDVIGQCAQRPRTACEPMPTECTAGLEFAVFGWSNVFYGRRIEFDLWPPARPADTSRLCAIGVGAPRHENCAGGASCEQVILDGTDGHGWTWHRPPQQVSAVAVDRAPPPRLVCAIAPSKNPTHLHCVWEDDAAEDPSQLSCGQDTTVAGSDGWTFGNPRMTPMFATSRFEGRFFLGWFDGSDASTACPGGIAEGE